MLLLMLFYFSVIKHPTYYLEQLRDFTELFTLKMMHSDLLELLWGSLAGDILIVSYFCFPNFPEKEEKLNFYMLFSCVY